jgi:hypothetical protein
VIRRRFSLELDSEDGALSGCLRDEQGTSHPFVGWLGLFGRLQSLAEPERSGRLDEERPDALPAAMDEVRS